MRKILAIAALATLAAVSCLPASLLFPSVTDQAATTEPVSLLLLAAGLVAARRPRTRRALRLPARWRVRSAPSFAGLALAREATARA